MGSKVAYCGKSPNLIGKAGIVKGFSSDHVFINWDGSSETMGCFLFLETDGVLEPQFRFECKTKVIGQTLECEYCHCFPCNDGKYLTYFKATNIGIKVVYVGPNENDYGRIGTVEDYKDGDFQVRYLAAKKSRFVPMIQPHETPGLIYFQFKFYCDKEVLDNYCDILDSLEDEENDEVKGSQDPSIVVTNNLPKCPNCLYSPCRNGQFLFQISDVASGMKLKYVGTTLSEMKGSTCVVKSVKPGFLTITGLGSKKNHFLIYSKGDGTGEVQFQYDCFGELDNNGIDETSNSTKPTDTRIHSFSRFQKQNIGTVAHDPTGDKQRIIFTINRDIIFMGVGLQLLQDPSKIVFMMCQKSDSKHGCWNRTIASQVFSKPFTRAAYLNKPLHLSSKETYMMSLSFYGGVSELSGSGLKNVNAVIDEKKKIKFFFYPNENMNLELDRGVVDRIYFKLPS